VHPAVLALAEDEKADATLCQGVRAHGGLQADEWRLLRFLQQPRPDQRNSAKTVLRSACKGTRLANAERPR
jgi:DNA topoisomerase-1